MGRRPTHLRYKNIWQGEGLAVYRRKVRAIKYKSYGQEWGMIEEEIAVAYLRPDYNHQTARTRLTSMLGQGAHTIMGDLEREKGT